MNKAPMAWKNAINASHERAMKLKLAREEANKRKRKTRIEQVQADPVYGEAIREQRWVNSRRYYAKKTFTQ